MNQVEPPAYHDGQFLPLSEVRISPLDRGYLFGDGIYEVIPAYGRRFLDLDGHLDRLAGCLQAIAIPNPHSHDQWRDIFSKLIDAHPAQDKKIYVQVTRGVQDYRDHDFSGDEIPSVFAMCSAQQALPEAALEEGISLYTVEEIRWSNCHLKTISLLPNVLLKHEAKLKGGSEALIVRDGRVVEGSSSNVFAVIEGRVHTPPTGNEILPGITRNLLLGLATDLGLEVVESELALTSAKNAQEVWISSSTRGVVAVASIDDQPIGDGKPGPVWESVYRRYEQMVDELRNG